MMRFKMVRRYYALGTLSTLFDQHGNRLGYTVERAKNDPDHPCIPEGAYALERFDSPKHGPNTWLFVNAALGVIRDKSPGMRDHIEFHPANYPHELLGCVAPGESQGIPGTDDTEPCVGSSRKACADFMALTAGETQIQFEITHEVLV